MQEKKYGYLLVILWFCFLGEGNAQVLSVFPLDQEIQANQSTDITITFGNAMDTATISSSELFVFGRWSGVMEGSIQWEADNTLLRFSSSKPFMAGEWVTISLSGLVQNMNGQILGRGYSWNFWTKALPGTFDYQLIDDISTKEDTERLVRSYGAYAGDLNRDGYSDLMIPNEVANDIRVFLNDGAGGYSNYTVHPIPNGSVPSTNEGSDFNRDGMIDFAVGNTGNDLVSVWMTQPNGTVSHMENIKADDNIRGLCVLDLNSDSVMDIVTANRTASSDGGNISLFINDGSGKFQDAQNMETNSTGETACATADANGDGILDVFIGAFETNEVLLFLGNGTGGLQFAASQPVGTNPWMLAAGDLNGDGAADVVSANSASNNVSVVLGTGGGGLQPASNYDTGAFPLAIDLGDLDGDGDLDVVTSNFSSNNYTILENEGNGSLSTRLTLPATTAASCTILHDRDNDGDLDITGIDELADRIFLFDNVTPATSVEDDQPVEDVFLPRAYPNPFGASTTIQYHATDSGVATIKVYDVLGRLVRSMNESAHDGVNEVLWDGSNDAGVRLEHGMYVYTITVGAKVQHGVLTIR